MKVKILICLISFLISFFVPHVVLADENPNLIEDDIICEMTELKTSGNIKDYLNSMEMIVISQEDFAIQELEDVLEILDNGTVILVTGEKALEAAQMLDVLCIEKQEDAVISGCILQCEGGHYSATPIGYSLLESDNNEKIQGSCEKERILSEIVEKETIDYNDIYNAITTQKGISLSNLNEELVIELQEAVSIKDAYVRNNGYYYFYANTPWLNSTAYYSDKSGYTKLGRIDFTIYAISNGTKGSETYDIVVGECKVGGLNDGAVREFNVSLGFGAQDMDSLYVANYSHGAKVVDSTTSFSLNTTADGLQSGYTISYTYESGDLQSVYEMTSDNRLVVKWGCKAPAIENGTFTVKPAVEILNAQGKNMPVVAFVKIDYCKIGLGILSYSTSSVISCQIGFCYHGEYNF